MGNSSSITNGSSTAAPRLDGEEDRISNKRKRSCDGNNGDNVVSTGLLSMIGQPLFGMLGSPNDEPSLSTMPDSVLLHTFSFLLSSRGDKGDDVEKALTTQLALEKTCRRFHALLGQDSTMKILYCYPQPIPRWADSIRFKDFSYQMDLREEMFIRNGLRLVRKHQLFGNRNFICEYMDGANGLRRIVDKILVQMELPVQDEDLLRTTYMSIPPEFPPNGFKLFLRGDSIAYLAEIVQQHMVDRWHFAMHVAVVRSKPADSHPYPVVCPDDVALVDAIRGSYEKECVVARHRHRCHKLSLGDSPKKWVWPENDCMDGEIIGAETMQRLVRAIAFQAGIVKLSGPTFDCIAAEILHYLAVIVIDAFEVSKSLWCQEANVGSIRSPFDPPAYQDIVDDIICDFHLNESSSEESIHSENSHGSEYSADFDLFNCPPPMKVDEEGKYVCVIIPRQIEDAAVRLGMKPLLDDKRWEVSEGRTEKEEVNEALLMYGSSLDDERSVSEAGSDSLMAVDSDETGEVDPSAEAD
jgi:hypothetical protein